MNKISPLLVAVALLSSCIPLSAQDCDIIKDWNTDTPPTMERTVPASVNGLSSNFLRKAGLSKATTDKAVCHTPAGAVKKDVEVLEKVSYDKLSYILFKYDDNHIVATLLGWVDPDDYYPHINIPDEIPYGDVMVPVTTVNEYAFVGGWGITGVTFGKNIGYIGAYSFMYTSIESVSIPSSVAYIGYYALTTSTLTSLVFEDPESVDVKLDLAPYALAYTSLKEVEIPARLIVGSTSSFAETRVNPFYGTNTLKKISINPAYTKLKRNYEFVIIDDAWCLIPAEEKNVQLKIISFPSASEQKSLTINAQAIAILKGAIYNANNLESISLTATRKVVDDLRNIQINTFGLSVLESLNSLKLDATGDIFLDDGFGLDAMRLQAYQFAPTISNYTVEDGVVYKIGMNGDRRLDFYPAGKEDASFKVPDDVTALRNRSFVSNKFITGVTLPDGLRRIDDFAFAECSNLKDINYEKMVIDKAGRYTLDQTAYLDNAPEGEVILGKCLMVYKGVAPEDLVLSSGVKTAATGVFNGSNVRSVTFPDDFENISESMFEGSMYLRHITWSRNLKSIGENAFYSTGSLVEDNLEPVMVLPEGLKSIGDKAFYYSRLCSAVDLPFTIDYIGADAFNTNNWFTSVTIRRSTPPSSPENTNILFNQLTLNQGRLVIPKDAVISDFTSAPCWNFQNIEFGDFTGIDSVYAEDAPGFVVDGTNINSTDGSLMQLYTLDGRCMGSAASFLDLPHGIYILKTATGSHKLAI